MSSHLRTQTPLSAHIICKSIYCLKLDMALQITSATKTTRNQKASTGYGTQNDSFLYEDADVIIDAFF